MSRCLGYVRVRGGMFERQPQSSPHTCGFNRRQLIQDDDTLDHVGHHSSERTLFDIDGDDARDSARDSARDIFTSKAANRAV